MDSKPIVQTLTQLSSSFPSQWLGKLEDGRAIYVRYRFGELSCNLNNECKDDDDISLEIGGEYDGTMSTSEMIEHLQPYLDLGKIAKNEIK